MTKRRGQAMTQLGTSRTPRVASFGASPLPIVMYGAAACEDTAITRSRLVAIGIPFRELDIDLDAEAARTQLAANEGRRATPTLVFGAGQLVVVEPTLERLGEALAVAGHTAEPPEARERAALAWTEALTLLPETGAPDDVYEAIAREFDPGEQVALTLAIVAINGWNRLAVGFRQPVGSYVSHRHPGPAVR